VLETRIVRAQERGEAGVFGAAEVEGDVAVEGLDGEGVESFVDEAEVLEVGGAEDLEAGGIWVVSLACGTGWEVWYGLGNTLSTMSALTSSDRLSKVSFAMGGAAAQVVWLGCPLSFNARSVRAAAASCGVVDGRKNAWAVIEKKGSRIWCSASLVTGQVKS